MRCLSTTGWLRGVDEVCIRPYANAMSRNDIAPAGLIALIVLAIGSPFALADSTPLWFLTAYVVATFAAVLAAQS